MKFGRIEDWCRQAVSQIKYPPDRQMVHQELKAHMEDRYEAYLERGFSEKEAEAKALEAMGSAQEIAPQLAAIHRPFWGYLLSISRYVLIVLLCIVLFPFLLYVEDLDIRKPEYLYVLGDRDPYLDEEYLDNKRLIYVEPKTKVRSDGYTFQVTKAAVWDLGTMKTFHFQMDVSSLLIWSEQADIGRWFWAEDSAGNYYYSFYEAYDSEKHVRGNNYRTGLFTETYEMWLSGYEGEDLQWVDLHYDRSGRDLVLRIDLTGGDRHE
ncbi:MAG: hypothetical protein II347_05090 [Lachnospiraceae bacterium]|nr:hypothetical protein [Lachnospiraceae bacterium]